MPSEFDKVSATESPQLSLWFACLQHLHSFGLQETVSWGGQIIWPSRGSATGGLVGWSPPHLPSKSGFLMSADVMKSVQRRVMAEL